MKKDAVVVGAGIAGLVAARTLRAAGRDVILLEASDRAGGLLHSSFEEGVVWEHGPNTVPSSSSTILQLAEDVGLGPSIIRSREAAETRLVYSTGKLHPVPTGPGALLKSDLFSLRQKLRVFREPFVRKKRNDLPESVAAFVSRRFGTAPARTLVDAFVSGIYAGDARRIGVRSAFPKLHAMEQESGSVVKALRKRAKQERKAAKESGAEKPEPTALMSFERGFGHFAETLAEDFGEALFLGRRVDSISAHESSGYRVGVESEAFGREEIHADAVVLAVPARVAGLLLASVSPMASDILFDIEYAPMLTVHALFDDEELGPIPEAFGFLIPRPQRVRTLGWLFNSKIFAGRSPEGKTALTGYVGGATDPHAIEAPEHAMRHLVLGELALCLRRTRAPEPEFLAFRRATPGIPQYDLGHSRKLDAVKTLLQQTPGLGLVGNYVGGISLEDCAVTAARVANELGAHDAPGAK